MTIGALARAANVTTSALRFYDDCGLVRPVSVDATTGYRYYTLDQIDEVVLIRQLREAGLPLNDVRRLLVGPVEVAEAMLSARLRTMEQAVETARRAAATALDTIRDQRGTAVSMSGRVLADAIGQVSSAADVTGDIPVLSGVLLETIATEFRLVATDRYRLAVRTLVAEGLAYPPAAAVVVATELDRARRWIGEQATVRLRFSRSHVRLVGSTGHRVLPIIEEAFPAYRGLLDNLPDPATQVITPGRALLSALGDDPAARVDLTAEGGGLTINSTTRDQETITVPAEIAGDPMTISFQFTTLQPAISASLGPDVMLRISRPDQPVVVRSADNGDFTTLAMPVPAPHSHGENSPRPHLTR